MSSKKITPSEQLVLDFLEKITSLQENYELIRVLKSRTYKVGNSNVLVRAASETARKYFFGLNYITAEEIANLDNPFIAFVCGSINNTIIIQAKLLFKYFPQISHDRNGEYKIVIDKDYNIVLLGRGNRLNCQTFLNNWQLLLSPPNIDSTVINTVEESLHSVLQGRLLEIGNIRGFETYCPDKSKKFNEKLLGDFSSLKVCPELQFSDYALLKQIDVIWFRNRGNNYIPEYAFEVELSTGVWPGVGRMATLYDYSNVKMFIISHDSKKYNKVMSAFPEMVERYKFIKNESLGELYSAEINLKKLCFDIGL